MPFKAANKNTQTTWGDMHALMILIEVREPNYGEPICVFWCVWNCDLYFFSFIYFFFFSMAAIYSIPLFDPYFNHKFCWRPKLHYVKLLLFGWLLMRLAKLVASTSNTFFFIQIESCPFCRHSDVYLFVFIFVSCIFCWFFSFPFISLAVFFCFNLIN